MTREVRMKTRVHIYKQLPITILSILLISILLLTSCNRQLTNEQQGESLSHFSETIGFPTQTQGSPIIQVWNMSFNEIREQLPYIKEAGFVTIQTSPVGDSIFQFPDYDGDVPTSEAVRDNIGTWWMLYQPRSLNIGNMLGTEEEFQQMIEAAHALGIHVIVDAIPNHMTSWWYEIDESLRIPEYFHAVPGDKTEFDRRISNWSDRVDSRMSRLLGLMDLNTGNPTWQQLYMDFLGRLIDAGVSGFRYDAMVHIELPYPHDDERIASDFWPTIQAFVDQRVTEAGRIPFQYGEILDRWHGDYLRALPGMLVTADFYGSQMRRHYLQGRLGGWDTTNFHVTDYEGADASRFVTWVESHDTYGNAGDSRDITDEQMRIGWALITARADTTPLFFVRPGEGFENNGQMFLPNNDGSYTNAWGFRDFFRDPTIIALNWFSNYFVGQPEFLTTWNDQVAIIERGEAEATTGIVMINAGTEVQLVDFPVQMLDGEYTCQVTGKVYTVQSGRITGPELKGQQVLVIFSSNGNKE